MAMAAVKPRDVPKAVQIPVSWSCRVGGKYRVRDKSQDFFSYSLSTKANRNYLPAIQMDPATISIAHQHLYPADQAAWAPYLSVCPPVT